MIGRCGNPGLRHAAVRVSASNLRQCRDNDKSEADLRGDALGTFVTRNVTPSSNGCKFSRARGRGEKKGSNVNICGPINQGRDIKETTSICHVLIFCQYQLKLSAFV